ncbi:hypothetical protein JRO89_XS04G0229800 [Xanthoceras sorbifolium]|uniref:Transmembrane protein 234 homolog n=1 Tax=Xanthoceras sorbifolium TaxID=99658 RepID=A0ABQ8I6L4_9ROSI|nr:hypothetical protein JRO89_XS04G0229800 [Xanthoceras sorbifolium]
MAMTGDVEKMVAVGVVWGATNALMRRGALIWDQSVKRYSSASPNPPKVLHHKIIASLKSWLRLLLVWQYSVPFLLNLSASATFFAILSHTPISLAVPVTNAQRLLLLPCLGSCWGKRLGSAFPCWVYYDTSLFKYFIVVIDHVVISDPLQLTHLGIAQMAVHRGSPPVGWGFSRTLTNADRPIPLASSCPESV